MNESDNNQYNPVFEKLVVLEDDKITGYIAYGIYKQKKRKWIIDHRNTFNRRPTDQEIANYNFREYREDSLRLLRKEAKSVLNEYADEITAAQLANLTQEATNTEIVKTVKNTLTQIESNDLGRLKKIERHGGFWRQFIVSLSATIAVTLILVALVIILAVLGIDILDAVERLRANDQEMPAVASPR